MLARACHRFLTNPTPRRRVGTAPQALCVLPCHSAEQHQLLKLLFLIDELDHPKDSGSLLLHLSAAGPPSFLLLNGAAAETV